MGNFVFQDLEHFPKTVWREGDPPLVNDVPPSVTEEVPSPTGPSRRRGLFRLWLIIFVSIHLAVVWTLLTTPDEYCSSPLQPIGGLLAPFVLWGVTWVIWKWSRS